MKAEDLINVAGGKESGAIKLIAQLLGINTQAVYAWKEVPPRRVLELEKLRPEWFKAQPLKK